MFHTFLEKTSDDIFKKLKAVTGDIGEENLGISMEDRQILIDKVNVVFHLAASLDLEPFELKQKVINNVLGSRRIMELSYQIKNLAAMVHVSSAFANAFQVESKEILYPAPADVEKIIELSKTLDDKTIEELLPS